MYINHSCNTLSFLILAKDILFGATLSSSSEAPPIPKPGPRSRGLRRHRQVWWRHLAGAVVVWGFFFFWFVALGWGKNTSFVFSVVVFLFQMFLLLVFCLFHYVCVDPWTLKVLFFLGWKNLGWKKKHFPGLMPWRNLLIAQNSDLGKSWTSKADGSFGGWFGWWFLICARV